MMLAQSSSWTSEFGCRRVTGLRGHDDRGAVGPDQRVVCGDVRLGLGGGVDPIRQRALCNEQREIWMSMVERLTVSLQSMK